MPQLLSDFVSTGWNPPAFEIAQHYLNYLEDSPSDRCQEESKSET